MEARGDYSASYPALHEMDRQLERYLPHRHGFFVEAGGNDGYTQSNTYALRTPPRLARRARRAGARARAGLRARAAGLARGRAPRSWPWASRIAEVSLRFGGLMTVVVGGRDGDDEWVAAAHAVGQEEPPHEFRRAGAHPVVDPRRGAGARGRPALARRRGLRGAGPRRPGPRAPRAALRARRDARHRRSIAARSRPSSGERYIDVDALSPFDILYARADVAEAAELTDRARR